MTFRWVFLGLVLFVSCAGFDRILRSQQKDKPSHKEATKKCPCDTVGYGVELSKVNLDIQKIESVWNSLKDSVYFLKNIDTIHSGDSIDFRFKILPQGRLEYVGQGSLHDETLRGFLKKIKSDILSDSLSSNIREFKVVVKKNHDSVSNYFSYIYPVGGRSRASIEKVIMEVLPSLQYSYNKWLRKHPEMAGKIKVKFCIDQFGTVASIKTIESSIKNVDFEYEIEDKIKDACFGWIARSSDITEAVYPFKFTR